MKLRIARKILESRDENDDCVDPRYRDSTLERALRRMKKTATDKASERYWDSLMGYLGRMGRAELTFRFGMTAVAEKHGLPNPFPFEDSDDD